jgi:aminoglycoside phosphotransferase (APT) family kinase protein
MAANDRVASVLETVFPDRTVAAVRSTGPSWNERNRTVGIEFADREEIYLKIATDRNGSRIARERAAIAYVGARDDIPVSVPEIVASEIEGTVPYLATAPMAGEPLIDAWAEADEASDADDAKRTELTRAVGAALAGVHDRRFVDHGHVVGGDAEGLDLDTGSWTTVLTEAIAELRVLAPSDRFDEHFDRVIDAVRSNHELLDDAPAALCHGDPARPNCVYNRGAIGLLDWELAHVGDPARDLHRARSQQLDPPRGEASEELVAALYDGYRERAGGLPAGFEARRPVYAAVRLLGVSGFFERWAAYADAPTAELATWLDAEMDRRLAAIR